ncbi:MAG: hypothetical protein LBU65_03890 [Planctomycetaceae bacterium]|jgi:hypothetical protein|nr:hypothetical protein [Planctomycetaceae bacterium]
MSKKSVKTKTTKRTANSAAWKAVSRLLCNLNEKEMLALFQELYHLSSNNAELIEARFKLQGNGDLLSDYRKKILYEFDDYHIQHKDGENHPKMSYCKKLIRDYKKGTGDLAGTLELMTTFQEAGAKFTMDYGDMDDRFYDSLMSGMDEIVKILIGEGKFLFPAYQGRLHKLLQLIYQQCGYGYCDWIQDAVLEIFNVFGLGIKCVGERKNDKYRTEYTLEIFEK